MYSSCLRFETDVLKLEYLLSSRGGGYSQLLFIPPILSKC